jgi:multicomponent Na+:H+ antiporter subunit D
MTTGELLVMLALVVPLFTAAATYGLNRLPDVRETVTVIGGLVLVTVCAALTMRTGHGAPPAWVLAQPLAGMSLAFRLEPLGAMFAVMASVLWTINSLFAIGYMRARREANQTRFYMCFAVAMFAVMGIAMAANLFTLFVFYEVLTLSTYPLVTHKGDEASRKAGRLYLGMLVGASVVLLLPGVIGVQAIAGSTTFVQGGLLAGKAGPAAGCTCWRTALARSRCSCARAPSTSRPA